jgi:hypothetical protein
VVAELIPNWTLLEQKLSPELCAEFMWMYRDAGLEHYKHIVTRRYLRLDQAGRCLVWTDAGLWEVPFESEWKRVSGRTGGIEGDGAGGAAGQRKDGRPKAGEHEETLKASGRASDRQPGGGGSLLRRSTCGQRRQARAGAGGGKRAGGSRDRVQE